MVFLRKHLVEKHRIPLVHHETKTRARLVIRVFKRQKQVGFVLGNTSIRVKFAQVRDDAVSYRAEILRIAFATVGQRAKVDVDYVMRAKVLHGGFVLGYLQSLEKLSRIKAAREKTRQRSCVNRFAETPRTRDADVGLFSSDIRHNRAYKPRFVNEVRRAKQFLKSSF